MLGSCGKPNGGQLTQDQNTTTNSPPLRCLETSVEPVTRLSVIRSRFLGVFYCRACHLSGLSTTAHPPPTEMLKKSTDWHVGVGAASLCLGLTELATARTPTRTCGAQPTERASDLEPFPRQASPEPRFEPKKRVCCMLNPCRPVQVQKKTCLSGPTAKLFAVTAVSHE